MPRRSPASTSSAPPEVVEIDRKLWHAWRNARKQEAAWKERAAKLRAKLEEEIGDSPAASINGTKVISWKLTEKRKVFNQAAFKAAHPDLYEEFVELKEPSRPFNETDDADMVEQESEK